MASGRIDDITKVAKDALYITVGLGVIAFQKAQVQRRELAAQLREQADDARTQLDAVTRQLRGVAGRAGGNGPTT